MAPHPLVGLPRGLAGRIRSTREWTVALIRDDPRIGLEVTHQLPNGRWQTVIVVHMWNGRSIPLPDDLALDLSKLMFDPADPGWVRIVEYLNRHWAPAPVSS